MPWDAIRRNGWELAVLDNYMDWARQRTRRVLISFGHSRRRGQELKMPSRLQFIREFRKLRRRYPEVQDVPDLERGQPRHAADLHEARARRAALQLDAPDLPRVHDHGAVGARRAEHDAAGSSASSARRATRCGSGRSTTTSTRTATARAARASCCGSPAASCGSPRPAGSSTAGSTAAQITRYNQKNAVRAIRNVFKLAQAQPQADHADLHVPAGSRPTERRPRWDSALVGPKGKTRPSLRTFQAQLRRLR